MTDLYDTALGYADTAHSERSRRLRFETAFFTMHERLRGYSGMSRTNGAKTNKLVIYLIKPEYQCLEDILDSTNEPYAIGSVGSFFFEESHPHPPDWLADFFDNTLGDCPILSSSAKGILIVPVTHGESVINFAIAFGTGRYLLKDGVTEKRFGLKVVLNSVSHEHLRCIDKTSLGSVPKHSKEQMSRDVPAAEFGIDIEQDLVSGLTAKSRDEKLGNIITGRDALSLSVKINITNIKEFLSYCYERYRSEDYKKDFDWIDQITEVRDKRTQETLNDFLVAELLQRRLDKIWMAVPEVIEWEHCKGFRYLRAKQAALNEDLDIAQFLDELGETAIDIECLKNSYVYLISAKNEEEKKRWYAFRCMYAEVDLNEKVYVLNNGKWYEIARDFTEQVKHEFNEIAVSAIELPDCFSNDEKTYNEVVANRMPGICLMDRKTIEHGGGHSKIEFCDLYSADGRMVHVKRYGASSVLSHLFQQGVVSGELFVMDAAFRHKVDAELSDTHKLTRPQERPDATKYEVVYAIISEKEKPLDIPFFSKVSLRNARRRLMGYGFKVYLNKIQKVNQRGHDEGRKFPKERRAT